MRKERPTMKLPTLEYLCGTPDVDCDGDRHILADRASGFAVNAEASMEIPSLKLLVADMLAEGYFETP